MPVVWDLWTNKFRPLNCRFCEIDVDLFFLQGSDGFVKQAVFGSDGFGMSVEVPLEKCLF